MLPLQVSGKAASLSRSRIRETLRFSVRGPALLRRRCRARSTARVPDRPMTGLR
jgi:hypothetical protein